MGLQWTVSKRTLAAVVMAATIFGQLGLPALAQDVTPVRLSSLEIDLWPEFDRPELLVIFQGRLADDVTLPIRLMLTLPQEVGEPHAVAWVDQDGNRLQAKYDVQPVGEDLKVTYTSLQGRAFQFEYYIDALRLEGQQRQFIFRYRLDVATDNLKLELQQPTGATNVVLAPPAAETSPGFAGLTYHLLPLGAVEAGQIVEWQVRYDKSSLQLSAEALSEEEEKEPSSSGASVGGSGAAFGVVAVIGVALAMVLAALWVVGSRRQTETQRLEAQAQGLRPPKPKRRKDRKGTRPRLKPAPPVQAHPSQPAQPAGLAEPTTPPVTSYPPGGYCHQCGTLLQEDALFCHRCGAQCKEA